LKLPGRRPTRGPDGASIYVRESEPRPFPQEVPM